MLVYLWWDFYVSVWLGLLSEPVFVSKDSVVERVVVAAASADSFAVLQAAADVSPDFLLLFV